MVEERSFTWCVLYVLENLVYMTLQDNTEICMYVVSKYPSILTVNTTYYVYHSKRTYLFDGVSS